MPQYRSLYSITSFVILLACCFLFYSCGKPNQTIVIKNVKLFDGEKVTDKIDVVITDGTITEIAEDAAKPADIVVDGEGKTIVPLLINAHVHVHKPEQLKESLQHGIGTVLDMFATHETARQLRTYKDSLHYANYYTSGPAATAPGGHGTQFGFDVPTITNAVSAEAFVKERIKDADYIKVIRDPLLPTLTFETIASVVEASHKGGKKVIAHVSKLEDAVRISESKVDGFAHIWFDKTISQEQLKQLTSNKPFVIPTLYVIQKLLAIVGSKNTPVDYLQPEAVLAEVKKLHDNRILILAGTDAPNLGINYHNDLMQELKLLKKAGLSDVDVLKTATINPAIAFGFQQDQLITKGRKANFLLINGDPTITIESLYTIDGIWKNGVQIR